ncbi:hypothetical protein HQ524_01020 [Candidatus Uhrbacteria bacterium]|nr:hypothetical protein [Candidatus Uhrbacteria bacterium]
MNRIIESCKFVADNSKHIKIDLNKLNEFSDSFKPENVMHWIDESPFDISKLNQKDKLHFLLVFNALSFSYWGDPKWNIVYNSEELDGAYGMIGCIARAVERKMPILDAKFLSKISEKDFAEFLEGNVEVPLFKERLRIIRNIGATLVKQFDGDLTNLVKEASGDSQKLVELIVQHLDSFNDVSKYGGQDVCFYKRAQLLTADIFQAFKGEGVGGLKNIDQLTACADYKLPMVLRGLGIFQYSADLTNKIDSKIEILKDSEEEIELRANTLWAIELITRNVKKRLPEVDAIHVNDHVWLMSQNRDRFNKPYHLTRTTAY